MRTGGWRVILLPERNSTKLATSARDEARGKAAAKSVM